MERELKKQWRKLAQCMTYCPKREAAVYFRQHPEGHQELGPFQEFVSSLRESLENNRKLFAGVTVGAAIGLFAAAYNRDVDTAALMAPVTAAFGALTVRDQRRVMFWNWIHNETQESGLDKAQRCLRRAWSGGYNRKLNIDS